MQHERRSSIVHAERQHNQLQRRSSFAVPASRCGCARPTCVQTFGSGPPNHRVLGASLLTHFGNAGRWYTTRLWLDSDLDFMPPEGQRKRPSHGFAAEFELVAPTVMKDPAAAPLAARWRCMDPPTKTRGLFSLAARRR